MLAAATVAIPQASFAVASISALEEGRSCRIQTSAPAGHRLLFDPSGWVAPFAGYWELDLTGCVVTVVSRGAQY